MNMATVDKIPPPDEFTSDFSSQDFSGTITFRHMSKTEIVFNTPSTVRGLKLTQENGINKMEYSDMVFESDVGKFYDTSLASVITDVVSDLIVNNETVEAVEENGFIKRTCDDYIVFQNKQSGAITEIISKKYDIKFTEK